MASRMSVRASVRPSVTLSPAYIFSSVSHRFMKLMLKHLWEHSDSQFLFGPIWPNIGRIGPISLKMLVFAFQGQRTIISSLNLVHCTSRQSLDPLLILAYFGIQNRLFWELKIGHFPTFCISRSTNHSFIFKFGTLYL